MEEPFIIMDIETANINNSQVPILISICNSNNNKICLRFEGCK